MAEIPLADLVPPSLADLRSRHLMDLFIEVAKPIVIGKTPGADRRIGEIKGGRFAGERLRGKVLSSGSDWQTVRDDGSWVIDVRLPLETDDGALIGMTYRGIRHGPQEVLAALARGEPVSPEAYYMRVVPMFETASESYGWLNRVIAVAQGHRIAGGAIYRVFEII